jgi:hypothetical protein
MAQNRSNKGEVAMKRLLLLCAAMVVLSGCATTSSGPTYQDPFSLAHFAQLKPGVTTPDQAIALFGIPTNNMDMAGGTSMVMWLQGTRGVSLLFKYGRLKNVVTAINVYLPQYEKERLGLTGAAPDDRLTPKALSYLHPGETTVEQAEQILGPPSSTLRSPATVLIWSHEGKMVSVVFKNDVMSKVLSLSNIELSHSELVRLKVGGVPQQ